MKNKIRTFYVCPKCGKSYQLKKDAEKCLENCTNNLMTFYRVNFSNYYYEGGSIDISAFNVNAETYNEKINKTTVEICYTKISASTYIAKLTKKDVRRAISTCKKKINEHLADLSKNIMKINTDELLKKVSINK